MIEQRLDRFHEAAIEAACDLDRDFAERHPDATCYVRPALLHELCPPGQPCVERIGDVTVIFIAPGLRARYAA